MEKFKSLQFKISSVFIVMLLSLILVQIFLYFYFYNLILEEKRSNNENIAQHVESILAEKEAFLTQAQQGLTASGCVWDFLTEENPAEKARLKSEIIDMIVEYQRFAAEDMYIMLGDELGTLYPIVNNIISEEYKTVESMYRRLTGRGGISYATYDIFVPEGIHFGNIYMVSFAPIYVPDYVEIQMKKVGTAIIFIKIAPDRLVQDLEPEENIDISLVHTADEMDDIPILKKGNTENTKAKRIYCSRQPESIPWKIESKLFWSGQPQPYHTVWNFILLESFFIGLLLLTEKWVYDRYLIRSIKKIKGYIDNYQMTNRHNLMQPVGVTEFDIIVEYINTLTEKLRTTMHQIFHTQQRLYEIELCEQKSELSLLQTQINPHFIYNTMECVRSISLVYGVGEIETIAVSISEIFRYSLTAEDYVTIQQEMDIVMKYIAIMDIRYPDSFQTQVEIEAEMYAQRIPKMILQPVVENVFTHGLFPKACCGTLKIQGRRDGESMVFDIYDDGVGISKGKLKDLQRRLASKEMDKSCLGLSNINRRIKLCYGEEYGVKLESEEGSYTNVEVTLPYLNDERRKNDDKGDSLE